MRSSARDRVGGGKSPDSVVSENRKRFSRRNQVFVFPRLLSTPLPGPSAYPNASASQFVCRRIIYTVTSPHITVFLVFVFVPLVPVLG